MDWHRGRRRPFLDQATWRFSWVDRQWPTCITDSRFTGVSRTDCTPERAYRVIDVAFDGFGKIIRAQTCHHSHMQFAANGIKELRGDAIGIVCTDATLLSPEAKIIGYPSRHAVGASAIAALD